MERSATRDASAQPGCVVAYIVAGRWLCYYFRRMWCLSTDDAQRWTSGRGFSLDDRAHPSFNDKKYSVLAPLSGMNWSRLTWLSRYIASYVEPFDECLLWVTLFGVWSSSENLHLFYRLRESYGERRMLAMAPAHLFLSHEKADLATFIELALLFGWDFYVLPSAPAYRTAFVSHDEFLLLCTDEKPAAEEAKTAFEGATLSVNATTQNG
jgi:hypothetical protein